MAADVIVPEIVPQSPKRSPEVVECFDLNFSDESFQISPLYKAITRFNSSLVLRRLQFGDDPNKIDAEFGTSYLHFLMENSKSHNDKSCATIVYLLSNAGIEIDELDYRGFTPLEMAIARDLPMTTIALLRAGADPSNLSSQNQRIREILDHFKPGLWRAVERNNFSAVTRLVYSWCRIRIARDEMSLLRYATEYEKSCHIISILKDNLASCEYAHAALASDENRLLELLPNRNIRLDSRDSKFGDVLVETRILGHSHLGYLLTNAGMEEYLSKEQNNNDEEWTATKRKSKYQNISRSKLLEKLPNTTPNVRGPTSQIQSEVCVIL